MSAERDMTPRLAATTIVVRARATQPEILLLKRGEHARFMPNAYVFAGGALDLNDESADVYRLCKGLDDGRASDQLKVPSNGLRFFVAAVREAFEECGLLFAYDSRGDVVDKDQPLLSLSRQQTLQPIPHLSALISKVLCAWLTGCRTGRRSRTRGAP